ncbi:TPA: hypothetical protein SBX34_001737, partial [Campylobacter coli]|nr:hypothetical protein [Campylobacter coli]
MFFNYKYQKAQVELLEQNKKTLELNIKIMNIAKLIFKSDEQLNILLPQASDYKNTNYFPQELELKKEMDVNLNDLKNCDNKK